jgi:transposase
MASSASTPTATPWPLPRSPRSAACSLDHHQRRRGRLLAPILEVGRPKRPASRNTASQVHYCARLRARPTRSLEHQATVRALPATAQRIRFQAEADQLRAELTTAGRLRSEAGFAALAGTNPIPASPGR